MFMNRAWPATLSAVLSCIVVGSEVRYSELRITKRDKLELFWMNPKYLEFITYTELPNRPHMSYPVQISISY